MTTVGLVPHPQRDSALEITERLLAALTGRGVEVRVPDDEPVPPGLTAVATPADAFPVGLDFAVSLGGDGTMLRTVDLVHAAGTPVLGVNLGQLGYLTEVEADDADAAVERVLNGDYAIEERMVLRVLMGDGPGRREWAAFNECVLEKQLPGRLIRVAVTIDGKFFTTYAADGMIVATPTGSTAYAFSARGPIISPTMRCMLLTPVSPHMLFDRSLVLSPDEEVGFEVIDGPAVEVIVDGRPLGTLESGGSIRCRGGEHPARLIVFSRRDFHQTLKAKFGLADR